MPLTYNAGYAVFSYMKKTNKCTNCYNFLTTDKQMENLNDVGSQYIVWRLNILHELVMTVSNCILSRRVNNFNALVAKSDNTKL